MKQLIVLIILFILSLMLFMFYQNLKTPVLGIKNNSLLPLKNSPNGVASYATNPNKKVAPLPFYQSKETSYERLLTVLKSMEEITIKKQTPNYIHAVATTDFFHFKDDLEFLLKPEQEIIHIRSQSRVGYSDMGVNRKRYDEIYNEYIQRIHSN